MNIVGGREIAIARHRIGSPGRIFALDDVLAVAAKNVIGIAVQSVIDADIKRFRIIRDGVLKRVVRSRQSNCQAAPSFATSTGMFGSGNRAISWAGVGSMQVGSITFATTQPAWPATGESFKLAFPSFNSVKLPVFIRGVGTVD